MTLDVRTLVPVLAIGTALAVGSCSVPTAPPEPASSGSSGVSSPARPSDPPEVAITATHTYSDAIAVRVSDVTLTKLGQFETTEDPDAKPGDPYAIATLAWTNGARTDVAVQPLITVRLGVEASAAPRVAAGDDFDGLYIPPGKTMSWDVAFLVTDADRAHVVIDVADAADPSHTVRFAGPLRD